MSTVNDWLARHHRAVLVTLRADGRAQTSNVVYSLQGEIARVSVTDTRAKTHNLRRTPHGVLHVLGDDFGTFVSADVDAIVGAITTTPGDDVGLELAAIYQDITGGAHPNWQEFHAAMVAERRLVLSLHLGRLTGQHPGLRA